MDLGKYVATIEANIKNFENNLNTADSVYKSFAQKNIADEKKRLEAIKKIIEQETGIRVTNNKEIEEATKNFNASQISNVKKLANAYVVHNNKTTASEKARTKAIIAESQRIEKQKQKEQNALKIAEEKRARQAEQASARVQKALQREAEKAESLRRQILQWSTLAITVPIVFGTKKAMQDFIAFQSELYNVKAVTGATSDEMKQMTETALEMSQVFAKTGTEIATAFLQLGQAGYEASEILTSAKDVMLLSAAGMKDIDFTAELVVTTLKAFNLEADQSGRIVDVFASSAAKSVSSLDKISASLKYTAGLWGSQNWEIENLIGILDVLFDTGVRGEKAGRLLASSINGLQKPTASASKAIEKLLGDVDALNPAMNDVTAIVKKLADANAKTADIFQIFGKEGTDVMLRLIQNVEKIDGAIAEVTGQTGEAAKQATIQMQSLGSQWDILKNKVTAFSKQVIGFMEPMFQSLIKSAGNFFDALNKMPDWLKTILTLGTTFALLGAPVAGLALKVKEFTAIMKIAGVTASATGLALKTAFPIMAAVGVAVGGIASAYAYSAKKHQEWIDSVNSGIEKLEKEGKSIDELVKDIEKIGDTKYAFTEVKQAIDELSFVFPELRRSINENANDTTEAISKMYEELSKLNKERAELEKTKITTASTQKEETTARLSKSLYENQSILDKIISDIYKSENLTNNIIDVMNKAFGAGTVKNIKEVSDYLGKVSDEQMEKLYTEIDKINGIGDIQINMNVNALREVAKETALASKLLEDYQKRTKNPIKFNVEVKDKAVLQREIINLVNEMESKYGDFQLDVFLGTEDKEKMITELGSIAKDGLNMFKQTYQNELQALGVIDDKGKWTEKFALSLEEGVEKAQKSFEGSADKMMESLNASLVSSLSGLTVAGIDDTEKFVQLQDAIITNAKIINEEQDKEKPNTEFINKLKAENVKYTEEMAKLEGEIGVQSRDAIYTFMAMVIESEKLSKSGGTLNKQLDWWGKIKQEISDIKNLLKGTDEITSLTDVMNQLSSATGEEYDKVISLGKALSDSFNENPRLKWYAKNFDIVNSVMDETIKKLRDLEIQQLKNAGVDTSIPEYINQLEDAGDKAEELARQLDILNITILSLDMAPVTESIEAIKAEIEKSGKVDFDTLLGDVSKSQEELLKTGKSTIEVNKELEAVYGREAVELFKQTQLAKQLEARYKKLKEKYGDGIIQLISEKQVNDAIDAEEQMLVAIGAIGQAQYDANKAIRERNKLMANDDATSKMVARARAGVAEYEEIQIIMEELNKDSSMSGLLRNMDFLVNYLENSKKKAEELKEELEEAVKHGDEDKKKEIEYEIRMTDSTSMEALSNLMVTLEDIIKMINKQVDLTYNAVDAVKKWNDEEKKGEASLKTKIDAIGKIGYALGLVTLGAGTLVGLLSEVAKGVIDIVDLIGEMIFPTPDLSYMQEAFEEEIGNIKKIREIEQAVYSKYVSLGESIGSAIADGIKSGSGEVDIENIVKTQLYDLIAQQILVSSGFNEKIAQAAKVVTNTVFENTDAIEALKLQIDGFSNSLDDYGNSVDLLGAINSKRSQYRETDYFKIIAGWRSAFDKETEAMKEGKKWFEKGAIGLARGIEKATKEVQWAIDAFSEVKANKSFNDQLDLQIAELQLKYDKAVELEEKINKAKAEIERLTKEQGEGITTSQLEIDTTAINQMAEEYEEIMRQIYEALDLQNAQVELEKNIRESLEGAFVNAVLTGSYTDFKKAVYDMIVSNITQAIISSGIVTNRLSSLVNSILEKATATGETITMSDVGSILNEIQSAWSEATDTTTPLGKLLMGLRDGLSEFGALDVNVNPGQVVTALPSEAMNKLDQAFQEVADRLSQAITESGLNSHIDIVNITTAYIEKMTANSVVINNATFDMSGDLVLNNISGATVGEFLENLIKEQVASAMP